MKMSGPIFFMAMIFGCQPVNSGSAEKNDPFEAIKTEKVAEVLKRATSAAGGWKSWTGIESIRYTKRGVLFLEDGSVESDVTQQHYYVMQPQFTADISWTSNDEVHEISYRPSGCVKKVNGVIQESDEGGPTETVMSSLYILGMPFKLLDEGTFLSYEGRTILRSGQEVEVIKATYSPDKYDNHSTVDEWYYYFDAGSGHFAGCMVYHAPTYAYIENLEFYESTPVKFHKHRKSYRSDADRNIKFLRAEFWYSDFAVAMKE